MSRCMCLFLKPNRSTNKCLGGSLVRLTPHPQKSVMTKSPKFSELDNPFLKKKKTQQPVRTLAHWTKCRAKVCVYVSVFAVLGLEVFFALQLFVLSYAVCTLLFLTFEHTFVCVVCLTLATFV